MDNTLLDTDLSVTHTCNVSLSIVQQLQDKDCCNDQNDFHFFTTVVDMF